MRLTEARDPLSLWQYAERYLGVGTRTYSTFSADLEIARKYHPQHGTETFTVPTFHVPEELGEYLVNAIPSNLHGMYRSAGSFLLPVHPETLGLETLPDRTRLLQCEPGPPLTVVPSANARTVFVCRVGDEPVAPHFLKLHYPRRLSRFTRRLRRPIIGLQLWVAAELHRIGARFLPEVGGGVLGSDPHQAWGYLIRELDFPGAGPAEFTIPLFALYGGDHRSADSVPLLEQLIELSGENPCRYVCDRIVAPMVRLWLTAVLRTGCALELHGQNTLFSFTADGLRTAVGYRDCAVYVDSTVRSRLGLTGTLPPINVIGRDVQIPASQVLSLAYDSFTSHHALSYLANCLQTRFGVRQMPLREHARAVFAEFPEAAGLLPSAVYYYDDELHPDGAWNLIDTGRPPDWR